MKKILLLTFSLALFTACEKDSMNVTDHNETANLEKMIPKASLDMQQSGMYAGVIIADQNNFHGKLWINLNNNSKISAMIVTMKKEVHYLSMVNAPSAVGFDNANANYRFEGPVGSFEFNPSNIINTEITNVVMNNATGVARVLKETSQYRMTPILGTYDSSFAGDESGTWNFIAPDQNGASYNLIEEVVITTSSGLMITENSSTFETGSPGCTFSGPLPPVFANYPNTDNIEDNPATPEDESATRDFAIYAINQTLPTGVPNKTILYDLGFSQNNADFNNSDGYALMTAYPEATRDPIFGDPDLAPGCYNISDDNCNGYYAVVNDTGVPVEGGRIFIDVSALISPTAPPTAFSGNINESGQILESNPQF
jgi:hypothetical protein